MAEANEAAGTICPPRSDADVMAAMAWDGVDVLHTQCQPGCCRHIDPMIVRMVVAQWEAAGRPSEPRARAAGGNK